MARQTVQADKKGEFTLGELTETVATSMTTTCQCYSI